MSDPKEMRLMVISLDGARLDLIRRWDLPFLHSLMEAGSSQVLKTVFPPHTLIAFASLLTGMDPAHHGIYNYVKVKEGRLQPTTSADLKGKTFMETLSDRGVRVGSINVPMTSSLNLKNGFVIGSWDSPSSSPYCHPSEIKTQHCGNLTMKFRAAE